MNTVVTVAMRDENDHESECGASEASLRWCEVLGDARLDRRVRNAANRLQAKHPNSDLDAEEVAQRIRIRLYRGADNFRARNGLPPDAPLRFKAGNPDWDKYAAVIIKNECARHADRMEREAAAARLLVSRDDCEEVDDDGDAQKWRGSIDYNIAVENLFCAQRKAAVEEAISHLRGLSRQIIVAYYRDGLGQRAMADRLGMSLASFQRGPWAEAKADFLAVWSRG